MAVAECLGRFEYRPPSSAAAVSTLSSTPCISAASRAHSLPNWPRSRALSSRSCFLNLATVFSLSEFSLRDVAVWPTSSGMTVTFTTTRPAPSSSSEMLNMSYGLVSTRNAPA